MATALPNDQTMDFKKLAVAAQQLKDNTGAAVDMTSLTAAMGTAAVVKAGASGTVGEVCIFPATASKGKLSLKAADNTGNTTTTVSTALQATTRAYTIPDAGADASFVMTQGAQTVAGQKTLSSMLIIPRATVAATGTNLATAAAVTTGFTTVTAADGTVGVKLPTTPPAGSLVIIKNNAAAVLKVWPDAAATINAIGSNANIAMAANTSAWFIADSTTQWFTLPLLPS